MCGTMHCESQDRADPDTTWSIVGRYRVEESNDAFLFEGKS